MRSCRRDSIRSGRSFAPLVAALAALATATAVSAAAGADVPRTLDTVAQATEFGPDPLEITDEMRAFVDERISRNRPRLQRLLELEHAVFDPEGGLGIVYGSSLTRTASETFNERSGNCISFTLLFVALSRHLGLKTQFVEVDEVTGWSQRGKIDLSHWHIYAEVELEGGTAAVDFLPWSDRRYRSSRRISENRARAHFYNNAAVDELTAGNLQKALDTFELALEMDSAFNPAKINMAVAYRRSGELDRAEATLLGVLADEKRNTVAAANLASLYRAMGRGADAEKWRRRQRAFLDRNPFHHFRLGMHLLEAGRPDAARIHIRRAINRQPDEALFFEQLAEANRQVGRDRKARRNLRRALELTSDPSRRQALLERFGDSSPRDREKPSQN